MIERRSCKSLLKFEATDCESVKCHSVLPAGVMNEFELKSNCLTFCRDYLRITAGYFNTELSNLINEETATGPPHELINITVLTGKFKITEFPGKT